MRDSRVQKGFTLVELIVALIVTGIVLTASVTLALALEKANEATDDLSLKQAQVRFATLRIQELIRHCKLICSVSNGDFALWRADDNNDGHISIGEIVYIEWGPNRNYLRICEFPSSDSSVINISSINAVATNWWLPYSSDVEYIRVLPQCSNVQCGFDVSPPQSRFVSLTFDVMENDAPHQYQIETKIRGWAENLLDTDNIVSDDD
jgi:prepilin-type N-terminal cleavage/methylation domain-containing protein